MNLNKNAACKVLAGFGTTDITSGEGVHLCGGEIGAYRPAKFVRHKLYAKASVFKGDKTVCVIGLDVLLINKKYCDMIKEEVMKDLNIPYEAIMVFAIQTHTAPTVGEVMLDIDFPIKFPKEDEYMTGIDTEYSLFVCKQAVEAARIAFANVKEVKMDVKSGLKHGLGFCRRIVMRDGTMNMFPPHTTKGHPCGPDISHLESPMDDEVGVVCFKDGTDIVGSMLHFTCHPVNDYCTSALYNSVSSDWPGVWAENIQEKLNIKNIPTVLNGCCGNVNPHDPFTPDYVRDSERMGKALSDLSELIMLSMSFDDAEEKGVVDYTYAEIPMDYRDIPEERLNKVIDIIENGEIKRREDGAFESEWSLAASTYSILCCKKREPVFMYPVQVFRIGGLAIVALPGEPFTDSQLDIKLRSIAPMTYVTHCSNKYVGYMPPVNAYKYDGHETNSDYTYWAKMAPGSIEKACDKVIEDIEKMFS